MPKCAKLLQRARNNPKGVRFSEACQLAECYGFLPDRQESSHRLYKRPGFPKLVNVQNKDGMAKPYQVRQLLDLIEELEDLGLLEDGDESGNDDDA